MSGRVNCICFLNLTNLNHKKQFEIRILRGSEVLNGQLSLGNAQTLLGRELEF